MEFFINITICSTVIYTMYPPAISLLSSTPQFKTERKHYIAKNIIKAVTLPILLVYIVYANGEIFYGGSFNNRLVRRVASAYVANDVVGLILCRLPTTTKMHHIVSSVFLIYSHTVDFNHNKDARLLFFYTLFSSLAFPVNLLLGLRHCYSSLPILRFVSKWVYLISLILNWTTQFVVGPGSAGYMILLMFIVYDDIILLKYLWRY